VSEEPRTPDLEEAFRRLAEALGRRDLDAAVAVFAPDAVLDTAAAGGLGGVHEGREAIRGFLEAWIAPFEAYEQVVEESRDLGNGVTLNVGLTRGRPIGTNTFVERRFGAVSISRDRLIERTTVYADPDQARAAAERFVHERGHAVARKNVDVVREMYEAFNRADFETGLALLDPQPELHQAPEVVDAEVYIGLDGFVRGMSLFMADWDEPSLEPQEVDEVGDFVVMRVRVSGRGKTTGLEMTTQFFHAWTFRDGKAWQCFVRSTRDEAIKAAGLDG
jgi:ketosteroid isomerase-like protein